MKATKPFDIPKKLVVQAYQLVKANKGAAGVDQQTIQEFEKNWKDNLYKIWNRMSSGSYFPPAVREVLIPKKDGRMRPLGIPAVSDRIAQMVVKLYVEPEIDRIFHRDSYGYRPNKSALDAVRKARQMCWCYDWVVDVDIKGFFDNLDHELMMKAVRKHSKEKWVLLYIERWLKAPIQRQDGEVLAREKGTPQGGVISPLLANLFLHYACDVWMERKYPSVPFERYADDIIIHCKTEAESRRVKEEMEKRLNQCRLQLHPEKTKIVYCKDKQRTGEYSYTKVTFLGYTFRPRLVRAKWGNYFVGFNPAVSNESKKALRAKLRSLGVLKTTTDVDIKRIAEVINPIVNGWYNYFSNFNKSETYPTLHYINDVLAKWVRKKYKSCRDSKRKAYLWLGKVAHRDPCLFVHWQWGIKPSAGR